MCCPILFASNLFGINKWQRMVATICIYCCRFCPNNSNIYYIGIDSCIHIINSSYDYSLLPNGKAQDEYKSYGITIGDVDYSTVLTVCYKFS